MNEHDLLGVALGNCTLERVIGKGGMAIVYLAQQASPMRTVAVKVLLPAVTGSDPDQQIVFLERFRREANTVAKLEQRNILPIYDYQEAMIKGQRLAYLVMPYIRGGTLRQRIDEVVRSGRQFDLPTVASYISQIAEALSYAHSLGVIHRDVKPGNLLFHSDGRLVLTDFGIVRLSAMPALTMVGSFIGTAEYASPEQVSAGELDGRSDIYALGIILYELLTGSVPFTGPNPFAVMAKQLQDPVPSVRAVRPDLSPAIEFVVKKALAKDPQARYQQATELAADLQAAVQPAVAQAAGLRLTGDGDNSDLTVADSAWQPPARALGVAVGQIPPTIGVPGAPVSLYLAQKEERSSSSRQIGEILPVSVAQPPALPLVQTPPVQARPANSSLPSTDEEAWQNSPAQSHLPRIDVPADESERVKVYRPSRRLYFYSVGIATLIVQFVALGLILQRDQQATIVLGLLLGNALNLLSLAAITFTGITRQRPIGTFFQRTLWVALAALVVSGFFISYGNFSPHALQVPLVSYLILLASNLFALRQLGKTDAGHEQIEAAPIAWRSALVGALTGLIPLTLILIFALVVPLPWVGNSSLFLRLLGALAVACIGAPTPGAMMAVSLSQKLAFPAFARTSALAGLCMFLVAYMLVVLIGLLVSGQLLFAANVAPAMLPLAIILIGALLGLIGLLRGLLDAWVYHRVMKRRA